MIRANLQRLISPHNQAGLLVFLVLKKSDITGPTLFPFPGTTVEFKELRTHLKCLFFQFLIRLDFDFFGKMYDGLKVDVRFFLLLYNKMPR